jgi:hypothetical protein
LNNTLHKKDEEEKPIDPDCPQAAQKEYIQTLLPPDKRSWQDRGWRRDYENLTDNDRLNMLVDETFALYIHHVS